MRVIAVLVLLAISLGAPNKALADDIHISAWGTSLVGAPYAVALETGMLKPANISGVISTRGGGGTLVRNALAGGVPFADAAPSAAIAAIAAGLPIKIVGIGTRNYADSLWIAKKDSPLNSIQDIRGKRAAITAPKSSFELQLLLLLQKTGIPHDQVPRTAVGALASVLTAISSGAVDIGPVIGLTWSVHKDSYKIIIRTPEILPPVIQTVLIASTDLTDKQPDRLRAILEGRRQAVDFIYKEPKQAAALIQKYYQGVPLAALEENMVQLAAAEHWSRGQFEREPLNWAVEGLRLIGEVEGNVDLEKMIDRKFLPRDQQTDR